MVITSNKGYLGILFKLTNCKNFPFFFFFEITGKFDYGLDIR